MASTETIQGSNIDPAIEIPEVDDMSVTGRAKDGVPTWDGNPTSYQEYEESALLWEQSVAMQKRYLCGPRLAAELTGAAKRLVAGRHPEWLSHHDGVRRLTEHLRHSLGKPLLSELTEQLSRFFRGSRRRSGESINDYITRKNEIYLRACQALQRVAPDQGSRGATTTTPPTSTWSTTWTSSCEEHLCCSTLHGDKVSAASQHQKGAYAHRARGYHRCIAYAIPSSPHSPAKHYLADA